ncbi:MAG: dephospho-CoA kinase [Oscillospiraceae bacterium]
MLDCDAVYHEMLRTDPALRGAIEGAFGPVFGPDGALDRQKLGNIVFSDPPPWSGSTPSCTITCRRS